ncbi:MAG: excinuclease ABC subunit UvrC [Bacteroidales bacterium]|jgi:excinuclease ABC subunit C|nr:excinuclease ABC subunit UvrC [Bacteroidales bacterium]
MMCIPDDSPLVVRLKTLPNKPGVYRYYDENGKLLYVGKAKNLKNRVYSYFTKNQISDRIKLMVSKIRDIEITVVDNEWEALLLENTMIKEHKPYFNILMRDDKSYPWIVITKEKFPRLFHARKPSKSENELYGPHASVSMVQTLIQVLKDTYLLRTCKNMPKGRPCLQYQLKKCSAPCAGSISQEEYAENIQHVREIIKGNGNTVVKQLREKMMLLANQWEFEKAQTVKEQIEKLEQFRTKSTVVNTIAGQVDVFSLDGNNSHAYLNFMRVMDGSVIQSYTIEMNNPMSVCREDLLLLGIAEIQQRFGKLSKEIIVPFFLELCPEGHAFTVPKAGEKKKLLDLSLKNAHAYMIERRKQQELLDPALRVKRVLLALQNAIGLETLPVHIECFDNSNTQGTDPVAAMVCFIDGKPAKREYRHFNIQTVEGPDDFASMREVVYRRYKRLQEEQKPLPQVVLIDGGKGQLNAANEALETLHLQNKIMLLGIAKRLEDIYKVGDPLPLYIDKKSEAQKLLQRIRDEVHRFGITHHRKRRSKRSIHSLLDDVPGIGKVLSQKLLEHFKSVQRIQNASEDDIAKVIGKAKAKILKEKFQ